MDADKDLVMADVDLNEVQKFDNKAPRRFQRRRQREKIPAKRSIQLRAPGHKYH